MLSRFHPIPGRYGRTDGENCYINIARQHTQSCKFAQLLIFAKVSKSHSEWMSHCLTTHFQRIYMSSCRPYPLRRWPYSCPWTQTSLNCAPAQLVVFHLLHTDRMQLYTVSEKVHQVLPVDFHSALQAAESMLVGVYHRSRHCRTHSKTKRYFSTHVTFFKLAAQLCRSCSD